MKDIEDIRNNIDALTQLVRIIAMSESYGMSYTHEEVGFAFRSVWLQLEQTCLDMDEYIEGTFHFEPSASSGTEL